MRSAETAVFGRWYVLFVGALAVACSGKGPDAESDGLDGGVTSSPASQGDDASTEQGGAAGTGSGSGTTQATDTPVEAEPSAATDGSAATEPSEDELHPASPENGSFETARRVPVDGSTSLQDELSADQIDYYVFEAEAGAYYEITTDRHRFSPDNMLVVYDQAKEVVAENDEGGRWPGDAVDARAIVRAAYSGDYFVRVEDPWTPQTFFETSFSLLYYHLSVRELDSGAPGVALAQHGLPALDPLELATDDATGYAYATLLGEAGGGLDVFALRFADARALIGRVLLEETPPPDVGSAWERVQYVDADEVVIAQISDELGQRELHPPSADARYEVRVTPGNATHGGATGFYAIDLVAIPENPSEQHDLDNGSAAGAEPIALSGSGLRRGLLLSTLPPDDVDYYRFEGEAGELASVRCESESGGSQVRGLEAALLDANEEPLGESEAETPTTNLDIPPVELMQDGTYFVRLSSRTPDVEPAAAWVRCLLTVAQ